MSEYNQALAELMAAPPAEFIARRKDLAKALSQAGQSDEAARLVKVRKPSLALAAVNQVARYDPEALELLLHAAEKVRRMQSAALSGKGPGPADLRSAFAAFQQALDRVARRAVRISGASKGGQEPARRLRDLLQAGALGDDGVRDALAHGRLTEEPPPIGFGGLTPGRGGAVEAPAPRSRETLRGSAKTSRAEIAAAERRARSLAAARARAGSAQAEAKRAESRAARLEAKAELAEEEARRLRREAGTARGLAT
ncbi:MAG TPA: hypothetical protein VH208_00090, partial [Myxococcaceae bacterium]|nr:hypothetical protein [Myxococcaceae bacterium]